MNPALYGTGSNRKVGYRGLGSRDQRARFDREYGVMSARGRPDPVVIEQSLVGKGRNGDQMAERRHAADAAALGSCLFGRSA